METLEQRTEAPVFRADNEGAKAKALWEMTQTEGWQLVSAMFFVADAAAKNARFQAEKQVTRAEPRNGTRDYWAGKLDTANHIAAWVKTGIKEGTKKEATNGR